MTKCGLRREDYERLFGVYDNTATDDLGRTVGIALYGECTTRLDTVYPSGAGLHDNFVPDLLYGIAKLVGVPLILTATRQAGYEP